MCRFALQLTPLETFHVERSEMNAQQRALSSDQGQSAQHWLMRAFAFHVEHSVNPRPLVIHVEQVFDENYDVKTDTPRGSPEKGRVSVLLEVSLKPAACANDESTDSSGVCPVITTTRPPGSR